MGAIKAAFLGCLIIALMGAVASRGFVGAPSGTTSVVRTFTGPAANLSVYAHSADVEVLLEPHVANGDTMVVRAGGVMTWNDTRVVGFKIIRPSATAVDAWWW